MDEATLIREKIDRLLDATWDRYWARRLDECPWDVDAWERWAEGYREPGELINCRCDAIPVTDDTPVYMTAGELIDYLPEGIEGLKVGWVTFGTPVPCLRDEELVDGITGVELENLILKMAAESVAEEFEYEVMKECLRLGMTLDEFFADPDPEEEG